MSELRFAKIVKEPKIRTEYFKIKIMKIIDKLIELVDIPCSPTARWEWVLGERKG